MRKNENKEWKIKWNEWSQQITGEKKMSLNRESQMNMSQTDINSIHSNDLVSTMMTLLV